MTIIVIPTVHFKTYELDLVSILQVVCMLVVWHHPATEHCQENTMKCCGVCVCACFWTLMK